MDVYIVLIDWGTMDGYRDTIHVDSVWSDAGTALARVHECRGRTPFPAVWAGMEAWTINTKRGF